MHYLFFDADNTLLDFDRAEQAGLKAVFSEYNIPYSDEVFKRYHRINEAYWRALEQGELTKEELMAGRFADLFKDEYPEVDGLQFNTDYFRHLSKQGECVPSALELLASLHERYTIVVATNGISQAQRGRMERSGLLPYIDAIAISEEAGFAKPARGFFDYAFAMVGSPDPADTLMIGDSLISDISGAQAYGMKTVLFDPMKRHASTSADFIIHHLTELYNVLEMFKTAE